MKTSKKNPQSFQSQFNRYFPHNAILYEPGFAIIFESPVVAIFLSQLLYWHGKGRNPSGWIYKTTEEFRLETGLTRSSQETAIRILKQHGVLETKLAQVPAKRHFRLDINKLKEVVSSLLESHNLQYLKVSDSTVDIKQTITENIQKTTTKNTEVTDLISFKKAKQGLMAKTSMLNSSNNPRR